MQDALVEITRAKLARRSGVDETAIERFERKLQDPGPDAIAALETLGAVFIEENGGGIGVRLKFNESEAKQIARLEGEAASPRITGYPESCLLLDPRSPQTSARLVEW